MLDDPSGPAVPVTDGATAPAGPTGRNLLAATVVGLGLGLLVLASLFLVKWLFAVLAAAAVTVAVFELAVAFGRVGIRLPVWPLGIGTVATLAAAYLGGPPALLAATALSTLAGMAWRMLKGPAGFVRDSSAAAFVMLYLPLLAGFAMLLLRAPDGARRVLVFILVTALSDIGGLAVGTVAGRHRMAPAISPHKSWEGLAGSVLFCVLGAAVVMPAVLGGAWWQGGLLGLAVSGAATFGDLAESIIKRDLGVKDMSRLLPGHGGMLDRLDSLLVAAPVAFALIAVFVGA